MSSPVTYYQWSHLVRGILAARVTLVDLKYMMQDEDLKPDFNKMEQALQLGDEFVYYSGLYKVTKLND